MGNGYTVGVSNGGHSEKHSRREYIPNSADRALVNENIVIYDCGNDREHFNDFFRSAIEAYNAKQKRNDRKKSLNYLEALEDGTEGYGKGEKCREKPFYHEVIQIGNRDKNGVTDSSFDVEHWRRLKADGRYAEASAYVKHHENKSKEREDLTQILVEIAEEIRDNKDGKYSNIVVHGLTIHRDEPNGTDHLDFRYSIFTDNEKTGLSKRVSMNKGLRAMGFETTKDSTALQKFRESIKDRIEEKMIERGYAREVKGLSSPHLPPALYEQAMRECDEITNQAKMQADEIVKQADERAEQLDRRENDVERERHRLIKLERERVKEVREQQAELNAREKRLNALKSDLESREGNISLREENVRKRELRASEREKQLDERQTVIDNNFDYSKKLLKMAKEDPLIKKHLAAVQRYERQREQWSEPKYVTGDESNNDYETQY